MNFFNNIVKTNGTARIGSTYYFCPSCHERCHLPDGWLVGNFFYCACSHVMVNPYIADTLVLKQSDNQPYTIKFRYEDPTEL